MLCSRAWAARRTTSSCATGCATGSSATRARCQAARGRRPATCATTTRRGRPSTTTSTPRSAATPRRAVWQADLDAATLWLDALPIAGEIVELAAGTGWWSPLLAQKGELWLYDVSDEVLDRARRPLVAHGLRAHIHIRDAWAEPDRQVDALFCGAWLSHVRRASAWPSSWPSVAAGSSRAACSRSSMSGPTRCIAPNQSTNTSRAPQRWPGVLDPQGLLRAGGARGGALASRLCLGERHRRRRASSLLGQATA